MPDPEEFLAGHPVAIAVGVHFGVSERLELRRVNPLAKKLTVDEHP